MLSTSDGGSHAAERAPHAGASGGPTQSRRFVVDDGHARIDLGGITGSCRAAAGERSPRTIEWELVLLRSGARLLPIRQDMFGTLALSRPKPQRIRSVGVTTTRNQCNTVTAQTICAGSA